MMSGMHGAQTVRGQGDGFDEKGAEAIATEKSFALLFSFFLVHLHALVILGAAPKLERRGTPEAIHRDVSKRGYVY
jgi:hypothetical protein